MHLHREDGRCRTRAGRRRVAVCQRGTWAASAAHVDGRGRCSLTRGLGYRLATCAAAPGRHVTLSDLPPVQPLGCGPFTVSIGGPQSLCAISFAFPYLMPCAPHSFLTGLELAICRLASSLAKSLCRCEVPALLPLWQRRRHVSPPRRRAGQPTRGDHLFLRPGLVLACLQP